MYPMTVRNGPHKELERENPMAKTKTPAPAKSLNAEIAALVRPMVLSTRPCAFRAPYRVGTYPATSFGRYLGQSHGADATPALLAAFEALWTAQHGTRSLSTLRQTVGGNANNAKAGNFRKGDAAPVHPDDHKVVTALLALLSARGVGSIGSLYAALGINEADAAEVASLKLN